jgi:hypothetical protein
MLAFAMAANMAENLWQCGENAKASKKMKERSRASDELRNQKGVLQR